MSAKREAQETLERFAASFDERARGRRRSLIDRRFTIVSNDCWGAEVYKDLGLPYATPLIGTFLMGPCYMALARDAQRIIASPLTFIDESCYPSINQRRRHEWYPIGQLADGVEVQFLHYQSQREAAEKWARRLERSHLDRLFFKLSADKDGFTEEHLAEFDRLNIRKVAFSAKSHPQLASVIAIPNYNVDGKAMYEVSLKHLDIVAWLNS